MSQARRSPSSFGFAEIAGVGAACLCVAAAGCDSKQSTAERLEKTYQSSGITQVAVCPFGGRVTVDNEPPALESRRAALVVMAYDASKASAPAKHSAFVMTQPDGSFAFPGGGLPPGKYVMLFAELKGNLKTGYRGPDALKNLYNDPDVNGKKPEFTIDHQAPGRTDYAFNLSVAGETLPTAPGPKALTKTPP
jgi:hypothetical protein